MPRLSRDIDGVSYAVEILVGRQRMSGSRPQRRTARFALYSPAPAAKIRDMYDQESASALRKRGFEVGDSCIRDGQLLVRVNNVFMFPADAEDLAHDRATLKQIIDRNARKIFDVS